MPFNGLVPLRDGSSIELGIETGNPVFIVGPNGSGKSSLMHYIALQNPQVSNRITAHRQNWLIQELVARRRAELLGGDWHLALHEAKEAALSSVKGHIERLASRLTERKISEEILLQAPSWSKIALGGTLSIQINLEKYLGDELNKIREMIANKDLVGIISRYPIRETPLTHSIIAGLGFQTEKDYIKAVRKIISDDPQARARVQKFFGHLSSLLAA